jgi:uncharacterized membrane protein YdbT with pleckstrin-like domain
MVKASAAFSTKEKLVMSYYEKVLQPGEQVKFVGRLHWIVHKHALLCGAMAIVLAIVALVAFGDSNNVRSVALVGSGIFLALAIASFASSWFRQITTEIVVTDKRIIHKVGWISRRTEEMNITKVETVDVRQGMLGRIFGYGTVLIIGIGGGWEPLTRMASPLELRNSIVVG